MVWVIDDLPAVAAYFATLETPPSDLVDVLQKLTNRVSEAGVKIPGIRKDEIRTAA